MVKGIILVGIAVSTIALNGCSTARGFGQDLEDLGRIIQGEKARNYQAHRSTSVAAKRSSVGKVVSETTSYSYSDPSASQVVETSPAPVTTYPYTPVPAAAAPASQVSSSDTGAGQTHY